MTGGTGAPRSRAPMVIVQARMGSQRLPGKILADLCGRPLLAWLLQRVGASRLARGVTVATTTEPEDEAVAALCEELGIPCYRGASTDVLGRFAAAAKSADADAVVRVSGDSPLLDPAAVDAVIERFEVDGADLVENHRRPGWPIGTAVEAMTAACLARMDREATKPAHREHVTLYAYDNPGPFRIEHVSPPPELHAPDLRLCVDTPGDLDRVREICSAFSPRRDFSVAEVIAAYADPR